MKQQRTRGAGDQARDPGSNPEVQRLLGRHRNGDNGEAARPLAVLAWLQGFYFLLTGVWPLLSIDTFQSVTGPKTDLWLVKTVGVLIAVIGAVLLVGARRKRIGLELVLLAAGSAAALAGIDIVYALADRISQVYLLDAIAEVALLVLWVTAWWRAGRLSRRR